METEIPTVGLVDQLTNKISEKVATGEGLQPPRLLRWLLGNDHLFRLDGETYFQWLGEMRGGLDVIGQLELPVVTRRAPENYYGKLWLPNSNESKIMLFKMVGWSDSANFFRYRLDISSNQYEFREYTPEIYDDHIHGQLRGDAEAFHYHAAIGLIDSAKSFRV